MLRLTFLACFLVIVVAVHPPFEVIFEWKYIEYNLPSGANTKNEYIPKNNAIAGIKLWKNQMYLTIPRWKKGVPVTLAVTSATPKNGVISPKLDPYPNLEMQTLGDCNAFQFVQSMEIDPIGRMWVLDTGRAFVKNETSVPKCSPRLVILDLENNGAVLLSYVFPDEVASKDSAYLNDIVLDHEDGGMAYITDSGRDDPGIIIYSLKDNKSWKFRDDSMKAQEDATKFYVVDSTISMPVPVDGIALSPPGPNRLLYYSPLSSFHIYSVPVSVLRNRSVVNDGNHTTDLGSKRSQSDGMIMTNQGSLYLGLLNGDSIGMGGTRGNTVSAIGIRPICRDHKLMQWLDTLAIDEDGRLWFVTNRLQNFINNRVNILKTNYRVMRSLTAAKNYQYFKNGTAPEIPEIPVDIPQPIGAADRIGVALFSWLIIALGFSAR